MSRRETKFYLKAIVITLFLICLFGYGVFEIWDYATGPKIILSSPTNGSAVSESLISIAGQGKNTKEITPTQGWGYFFGELLGNYLEIFRGVKWQAWKTRTW